MINKIFRNRYIILYLQFLALAIFVLIIYNAINVTTNDQSFAKILRNTNLSNLVVWSYWWPLIVITAIIFGRFWCSICPVELITSLASMIGLRRKPNRLIKSGWLVSIFYATILIVGITILKIHRIPQYMAYYLLLLCLIAAIIGLIYEKRTFCTYICPVGNVLGLYSLFSFKKIRAKNFSVCTTCKSKDCISSTNHYKLIGRSCTSNLYPPEQSNSKDCILCGECIKSCTKNNLHIVNEDIAVDYFKSDSISWAQICFILILSIFMIYEIFDYFTILLPLAVIFSISAVMYYFTREKVQIIMSRVTLIILPFIASMHFLKAVIKTTSRIPYWHYSLNDIKGMESAKVIIANLDLVKLNPIISYISDIAAVILPLLALIISIKYIIRFINK